MCTFFDRALTWWNGHVKSFTLVLANAMGWETLKDLIIGEYCPRGEVQKIEHELWSLTMKGSNIVAYTTRFSDLMALCPGMVPTESMKIERYIRGLVPPFQGNVLSSNPSTFYSAKRLTQRLIDHGICPQATTPDVPEQVKTIDNKKKLWEKKKNQSM